jgi:tRNA uridine 5-carboxymethylaminomethyl modification enzyme
MEDKYRRARELKCRLSSMTIIVTEDMKRAVNEFAPELVEGSKIALGKLLKRPGIRLDNFRDSVGLEANDIISAIVEMEIKYEGYIAKERERIERVHRMEKKAIPEKLDYDAIKGLKSEARDKLKKVVPATIGHAMRISGVDPTDISILLLHIESTTNER